MARYRSAVSVGRSCYELYAAGVPWAEVARRLHVRDAVTACLYARLYRDRHGLPRLPFVPYAPPARCGNCGVDNPPPRKSRSRCLACYRYRKRTGRDRPERLWRKARGEAA